MFVLSTIRKHISALFEQNAEFLDVTTGETHS